MARVGRRTPWESTMINRRKAMYAKFGCFARRVRNVCSRKAGVLGVLIVLLIGSLAVAREYRAGTPIGDVSITSPTANPFWAAGSSHTLTCTTPTDTDQYRDDPEDAWQDIPDSVTYYWEGTSGSFENNNNTGDSVIYICPISPGTNTLTVYADDNYDAENNYPLYEESPTWDEETVTIVTVARIQWYDGGIWTDVSGAPLNVLTGTTVSYKAIPAPAGASWPAGYPVWGGEASGTGETKDVTFSTLSTSTSDYKEVKARCGTQPWVTVNAIVFDFLVFAAPIDFFEGRSLTRLGLEEKAALELIIVPAGTATGTVAWTKTNGVGSVTGTTYDAEHVAGGVTLRATLTTGPSSGKFREAVRTVVAPSGTRMTRVNTNVWHKQGIASAGIALYYWLDPKDVSFKYLTFGEDACPATDVDGFFLTSPPGPHTQNTLGAIGGGNSQNGCRLIISDKAGAARKPWGNGGTYTWSIPTQYIDDNDARHTFGNKKNHVITIQPNGTTTVAKGGQSGSAAVNAPTSGF